MKLNLANNEQIQMTRRYPDLPRKVLQRDSEVARKIMLAWDMEQNPQRVLNIYLNHTDKLSDERYWELMRTVWILVGSVENGIGLQKLEFTQLGIFIDDIDSDLTYKELANNDGLSLQDYHAWFKNYPTSPQAVIHFTGKRYANSKTHKGKGSWLIKASKEEQNSEAKEM